MTTKKLSRHDGSNLDDFICESEMVTKRVKFEELSETDFERAIITVVEKRGRSKSA